MPGGEVIRRARRRACLSQVELARRLGTTASALSRWENDRAEPSYATVDRAVEACGLTLVSVLREPDVDPHDASLLGATLAMDVDARARSVINYARAVESARASLQASQ